MHNLRKRHAVVTGNYLTWIECQPQVLMSGIVFLTVVASGTEQASDAEVSFFPLVKLYFILGQYLQADLTCTWILV
jgi:hypothetical protein